jgi:septum formation protein
MAMRLVLASASPRRADLLRAAGFVFETLVVDLDERVLPGEAPAAYVRRLAMEKSARAWEVLFEINPAEAGSHARRGHIASTARRGQIASTGRRGDIASAVVGSGFSRTVVLAADTAVVIGGTILGKPRDDLEAASMLRQLSGRPHEVLTGVSLRTRGRELGRVETTVVEFSPLTEADVTWYIASGEGRDKAGAYAIQGLASRFIPRIRGSYANVVGLPVAAVHELVAEIASEPQSGLF